MKVVFDFKLFTLIIFESHRQSWLFQVDKVPLNDNIGTSVAFRDFVSVRLLWGWWEIGMYVNMEQTNTIIRVCQAAYTLALRTEG